MLLAAIRKTQPTTEPVTMPEVKDQLRIPAGQYIDDELIHSYIGAAREQAEQFIDRPICQADYTLVYDLISSNSFRLCYPASAVSSVTYRDHVNAEQTATFTYDADLNRLFFSEVITGTNLKVNITSGINSEFPESLKQAILMLVSDIYTGRASVEYTNKAAQMMLMPFKNRPIL